MLVQGEYDIFIAKMHDSQDKIPSERVSDLIRCGRAIHSVLDRIDDAMERSLGINRSDLRCLNLLEHGPLTPTEIGRRLDLTSGSVTALIDRLVERELVSRMPAPKDRRSTAIELRPMAFAHLGARYRLIAESITEEFENLSDRAHGTAIRNLDALIGAFERGLVEVRRLDNEG